MRDRLQPGAPLYLVSGVRVDETNFGVPNSHLQADFLGAWRHYGEVMGMPAEQMASIVAQLAKQMSHPQVATAERVQELLREAGIHTCRAVLLDAGGNLWVDSARHVSDVTALQARFQLAVSGNPLPNSHSLKG